MGGGPIQLIAKGLEDIYLTQSPQINFFYYSYYQYLNYANDIYKISLDQPAEFGNKSSVKIPKYGHLLSKLYLHIKLPKLVKTSGEYACWCDNIGYAIFDGPIELQIGGVIVDRIWPVGHDMFDELTVTTNKIGSDFMTGKSDMFRDGMHNAERTLDLMIDLKFWFTRHYSMALPLICMQKQEVQLNFTFKHFNKVINFDGLTPPNQVSITESFMYTEYIQLDDIIINQYINEPHTYIIQQIKSNNIETIPIGINKYSSKINIQNVCQEILFCCVDNNNLLNNNYFNFSRATDNEPLISTISLLLNGKHRYDNFLPEFIFRQLFPKNVHSVIPTKHQYLIPFALKPEDYTQPSGSLNLSKFDEITLNLNMNANNPQCQLHIYCIVHNVITIEKGILKFKFIN